MFFANWPHVETFVSEKMLDQRFEGIDLSSVGGPQNGFQLFIDWARKWAPREIGRLAREHLILNPDGSESRKRAVVSKRCVQPTDFFRNPYVVDYTRECREWRFRVDQSHRIQLDRGNVFQSAMANDADIARTYNIDIEVYVDWETTDQIISYRGDAPIVSQFYMQSVWKDVIYIFDWWVPLDDKKKSAIAGMSFAQAFEAARKWHAKLLRLRPHIAERLFPHGPLRRAPIAAVPQEGDETHRLDLDDGYYWARLATKNALQVESDRMRHCVGRGSYDHYIGKEGYGIWSLRKGDKSCVTVEIGNDLTVRAAMAFGNAEPPAAHLDLIPRLIEHVRAHWTALPHGVIIGFPENYRIPFSPATARQMLGGA